MFAKGWKKRRMAALDRVERLKATADIRAQHAALFASRITPVVYGPTEPVEPEQIIDDTVDLVISGEDPIVPNDEPIADATAEPGKAETDKAAPVEPIKAKPGPKGRKKGA